MYFYIYDDFVQDNKKFEKELLQIENRLTDLDIAGKIARLALFRDPEEMIRDELRRGVTTVIVVGNDQTVRKVLDVVAESGVTFGIIPLGTPNVLAKIIGIPEGVAACDVLSARIVETIDIGTINGHRFITGVSIPNFKAELTCEGAYRIIPKVAGLLEVRNLVPKNEGRSDPRDGLLETVLRVAVPNGWGFLGKKQFGTSFVPAHSFAIRSDKPMKAYADGEEIEGTRFDISVDPVMLKMITGRGRLF